MCTVHSDPPVHRYHSDPPMLNQRRYYTRTLHCLPVKLLYVCVNSCALQYWYDSSYSFTVHTVLLYIQFYCPYRFTVHTVLLCSGIINPCVLWVVTVELLYPCWADWQLSALHNVKLTEQTYIVVAHPHSTFLALHYYYMPLFNCALENTPGQCIAWRIGWLTAQLVSPVHRQCALGSPVQTSWTANSTPQGKHKSFTTSIIIRLATSYWHNIYYIILGALCALTKFFITTPVSM